MAWSAGAVLTAAQLNAYVPQTWIGYAPVLAGAGTAQGNATMTGGYIKQGLVVHFFARAVLGSTSVIGSAVSLSLPYIATATQECAALYGRFDDVSSNFYLALPYLGSTTTINLGIIGVNGAAVATSSTAPFTWVAGDIIGAGGTYRVP